MHYSIHVFPGIRGPCFTGPESILLNRLLVSVELLGALLVRTVYAIPCGALGPLH